MRVERLNSIGTLPPIHILTETETAKLQLQPEMNCKKFCEKYSIGRHIAVPMRAPPRHIRVWHE